MKLSNAIAFAALGASLAIANSSSAQAKPNAFYRCDRYDGLELVDGKAFYHEIVGRDSPTKTTYVGTYTISNERILNADYRGKSGYTTTKIYKIRRADGTLMNQIYLPVNAREMVCQ